MPRTGITALLFAAATAILAMGTAQAEQGAGAQQGTPAVGKGTSYKQLITFGYEVKNVLIIPIEEAKQFQSPNPLVLVTLQKSSSTASCLFGVPNWVAQLAQSLESPTQCHTYPPQ